MQKLNVAILYGGRSGEHEVSLVSAASVFRNLDRDRFNIIPIAIDKQGRWLLNDANKIDAQAKALPVYIDAPAVVLPSAPVAEPMQLVALESHSVLLAPHEIDVVFPVMHGPLCEDGTVQGLLELAEVPYVGCGVLASAVGMDKDVAKRLARDYGIPVVPWVTVRDGEYAKNPADTHNIIARQIGFPNFVKPANMGSSVGVVKVKSADELARALQTAFSYDTKVLVEKAINAREIEVAVLQPLEAGLPPITSIPGEVTPTHEFYSYEAKYIDANGARLKIPADLDERQIAAVQKIAADVFTCLEGEGLARVDFFFDRESGQFYFNEVNTLPGFTSISMYPKLMEASGIAYGELLTHLIDLAMARHQRKSGLKRDFTAK